MESGPGKFLISLLESFVGSGPTRGWVEADLLSLEAPDKAVFAFQWLVIEIEYQLEVATILVVEKNIWLRWDR